MKEVEADGTHFRGASPAGQSGLGRRLGSCLDPGVIFRPVQQVEHCQSHTAVQQYIHVSLSRHRVASVQQKAHFDSANMTIQPKNAEVKYDRSPSVSCERSFTARFQPLTPQLEPVHECRGSHGQIAAANVDLYNIKERLDYSCALFSPNGDLVANAPFILFTWDPCPLRSISSCGNGRRPACRRCLTRQFARRPGGRTCQT